MKGFNTRPDGFNSAEDPGSGGGGGGGGTTIEDAVRYNHSQNLSESQKERARNNIGAANALDVIREIKMLVIGNSFTEDEFSYVPFIMKNIAPKVKMTLGIAHIGGSPLAQHTAYFTGETIEYNGVTYSTNNGTYYAQEQGQTATAVQYGYHKSVDGGAWDSIGPQSDIDSVIGDETWDIIVFQSDVVHGDGDWDTYYAPYIFKLEEALLGKLDYPVKLGWAPTHSRLLPEEYTEGNPPGNAAKLLIDRWKGRAENSIKLIRQTGFSIVFPSDTAVQNLRHMSVFRSMGRAKFLAWDTTGHLQEGIGPLASAYANTLAVLNAMGLGYKSVIGERTRPDGNWIVSKKIPSAHGYVKNGDVITWYIAGEGQYYDDFCTLAQIAAVNAAKFPFSIINPSVSAPYNDREVFTDFQAVEKAYVDALAAGKANVDGAYPDLVAGDLVGMNDRVTVADKFVIRTTAGDESIESGKEALLLELTGGCGDTEAGAFKINALQWNGANQLDPSAWEVGKTSGYLTGAVANGAIGEGSNKLCIIRCPKCEAGAYGTAEANNGYLLTDSNGNNMKVGDGSIIGVWHCATLPASGSEVTAVTEHTFARHAERFYLPDEGYMIVEAAPSVDLTAISAHIAWSKDYDKFELYSAPVVLIIAASPLTTAFQTETINGKTCLVLRGIEQGKGGIFDRIIIYADGGGIYERNIAASLLSSLSWTETEIEAESIEGEGGTVTGYRYTASLPTSGTYAAMRDGLIRSDIEGMTLNGFDLVYESETQITPATAFAEKYVDYQMATPVTGSHSINPAGKPANDMGTEEVVGGDSATGTIVISYVRGFKDSTRAMMNEFEAVKAELKEQGYTKPLFCVGEWVDNANTASPIDLDNPDALAVLGNKDWALDWRPFLVDMTAVEGETKKRPVMELRKNNWLRDIYGNWAPVVGITEAMYNECMANDLYTDSEGQNQYCAAGAYNSEAFLALCQIEVVDGVKKLTHPQLYKAVTENEETTYVEVTHYLMPWETAEVRYSIFVGRKDEVFLLDGVVGSSGKEWNGILGANANVWDGVDVKTFALKPTGICPSPATAISDGGTTKLRSFFFNYPSSLTGVRGRKGYASNCDMFYDNGHYPTSGYSQIDAKTTARRNNHDTTAPFPVAEGGFHARNTFLRCVETALGTKYLCSYERFSSGISAVDACGNETQWLERGGVRIKASNDSEWTYKNWAGNGKIYYKDGSTYKTIDMAAMLTSYGPHMKTLESQIAVSFAVEFGIAAGEKFNLNGCTWWYANPTTSTFTPPIVADGYMNCRVYKIVAGSFEAYSDTSGTEETFTVECCLRVGLMLGCDMSGDIGPYWGGGCEIVGECKTAPVSGSYGYTLKAYIETDQEKWVNEGNTNVNIGEKFPSGFEDKYRYAGSVVTRTNGYIRRRLPNTPLPITQGAAFGKGECGYGYMANYWGTAGKKTRVGVRSGYAAASSYLSARYLYASYSASFPIAAFCASAQVLLDMQ